jgi:hypothetical protein
VGGDIIYAYLMINTIRGENSILPVSDISVLILEVNLEISENLLLNQLVSATPLKLLNRIS